VHGARWARSRGVSRWVNLSGYIQDQIRATSRLSLTLGLRYEFYQPEQHTDGFYSFFLPSSFDRSRAAQIMPANGQIVPGTENFGNGVIVVGNTGPFGNAVTNTVYNTFAPRGGFTYALTRDSLTVLGGGFGMFHDRWAQNVSTLRNNHPFNQSCATITPSIRVLRFSPLHCPVPLRDSGAPFPSLSATSPRPGTFRIT
jgi:hypothetical protein